MIVDAYDAEEQAMGWYYYLAESMSFPFDARCVREMRKSPLRLNELITRAMQKSRSQATTRKKTHDVGLAKTSATILQPFI